MSQVIQFSRQPAANQNIDIIAEQQPPGFFRRALNRIREGIEALAWAQTRGFFATTSGQPLYAALPAHITADPLLNTSITALQEKGWKVVLTPNRGWVTFTHPRLNCAVSWAQAMNQQRFWEGVQP